MPTPNSYIAVARLLPALFTVSPGLFFLSPDLLAEPDRWIGLAGALGGYTVIALIVRRIGRWREPRLLTLWGGYPTTAALRLTNSSADPIARARRRAAMENVYGFPLPTAEEETQEPARSTQRIRDAERRLRAKAAANAGTSPLLASENRSYGFMRNTWALKPLGIVVSVAACGVACFLGVDRGWTSSLVVTVAWSAVVTMAWLAFFRPAIIHAVAQDYAERFFDVLDQLPESSPPSG